ncbi:MAG: hypothetical protein ACRC9P_11260, partial [Bacteroides sp.]
KSTANSADAKADKAIKTSEEAEASASKAVSTANDASKKADTAVSTSNSALEIAKGADVKSDKAITDSTGALSQSNKALGDSAKALEDSATALKQSSTAISTANDANSKAEESLGKSEEAIDTANTAKDIAEGIDAKATEALEKSKTAESNASSAKETAERIAGVAQDASDTANEAKDIAQEALDATTGDFITQELGQSTSKVISQKVVTDELDKKLSVGDYGLGGYLTVNNTGNVIESTGFYYLRNITDGGAFGLDLRYSKDRGAFRLSNRVYSYDFYLHPALASTVPDDYGKLQPATLIRHDRNTFEDKNGYLNTSKDAIPTLTTSDMADTVVDNDTMTVTSGAVYRANKSIEDELGKKMSVGFNGWGSYSGYITISSKDDYIESASNRDTAIILSDKFITVGDKILPAWTAGIRISRNSL